MTVGLSALVASHLGLSNGQLGQNGPGEIGAFFVLVAVNFALNDRSADCSSRTLAIQH
jgi:hypothetical protein